jgi:hypothetical protein
MFKDHLKYEGTFKMQPFNCTTCGQRSTQKYLLKPHPAVAKLLETRDWREICKKCAKREVGSKNKKGWERLHADS